MMKHRERSPEQGLFSLAQDLVDKYSGTGDVICIDDKWTRRERITAEKEIGLNGEEIKSNKNESRILLFYKNCWVDFGFG